MIDFIKKQSVFIYVCLFFAFLQSVVLCQVFPVLWGIFLIDGVIQSLFYIAFAWIIWRLMVNGNLDVLPLFQRIINFTVIGLLITALILITSFLLLTHVFSVNNEIIIDVLWLKGYTGIFIFMSIVSHIYHHNKQFEKELEKESNKELEEEPSHSTEAEILERVAIKNGKKIDVVLVPDIIYIQADGDYVQIYTNDGRYMKEDTMKFFQEHLPADLFVRIHRSYIVNIEKIKRIDNYEKQNQIVTLKNGEKIKASIAGYKNLKSVLSL